MVWKFSWPSECVACLAVVVCCTLPTGVGVGVVYTV